jgi:hypothetical protein
MALTNKQEKALVRFEKALQAFIDYVEENPRRMITAPPSPIGEEFSLVHAFIDNRKQGITSKATPA